MSATLRRGEAQKPLLRPARGGEGAAAAGAGGSSIALPALAVMVGVFAAAALGLSIALGVTIANQHKMCGTLVVNPNDDCVDIVIVGGGAAGNTVAEVVSRNGTYETVVLEAGDDNYGDSVINDPDGALITTFYFVIPQYFWPGESVTQAQLNQEGNVNYRYTNGRLLGGGSAINTITVVRGTSGYWDRVDNATGNNGAWTGANIYALMQQQENFTSQGHWTAGATRGTEGPWTVTARSYNGLSSDATNMVNAICSAAGVPVVDDYNDPAIKVGGVYRTQMQQRHDTPHFSRSTSATAFLNDEVMNQTTYAFLSPRRGGVRLRSTVQRLLWDPSDATKCVGVEYIDADNGSVSKRIYANKAVVLSAGIRDAQMLQIEGIGPAATLATAGVAERVVNEHVGRHYQNHVGALYTFLWDVITDENSDTEPGNILRGGQVFASDPSALGIAGEREFQIIPFPFPGGFLLIVFYARSPSEGTIDIQNGDPNKMPLVDPKYLTATGEVESHREMFKQLNTGLASYNASITLASAFDPGVDAEIDAYIIENIKFAHHYTAQTRMGTTIDDGVVDWRTRVFGTTNLRVCSASILPIVPDGNTCTPSVAVGGQCGAMLVEDLL
jgi:choline dehydrogenase